MGTDSLQGRVVNSIGLLKGQKKKIKQPEQEVQVFYLSKNKSTYFILLLS